jgi:hypothetical protein
MASSKPILTKSTSTHMHGMLDLADISLMETHENAREKILERGLNYRNNHNKLSSHPYPYSLTDSTGWTQEDILNKTNVVPSPTETFGQGRTVIEGTSRSGLTKGIAYQCNINERGEIPFGYTGQKYSRSVATDIEISKAPEKILNAGWKMHPYEWKANYKKRQDWRLLNSWCTNLPLYFDTNEWNKPQCEHKPPLFQQVYLLMGPNTLTEMRQASNGGVTKSLFDKLRGSVKKFALEIALKANQILKTNQSIKYEATKLKLNNHIQNKLKNTQVIYGSDILSTTGGTSIGTPNDIQSNHRVGGNFLINKYLIRQECYAWETPNINEWGKNKVIFLNINVNADNVISYDIDFHTIERFINQIAFCKLQTGVGNYKPHPTLWQVGKSEVGSIASMWARIGTSILKLSYKGQLLKDIITSFRAAAPFLKGKSKTTLNEDDVKTWCNHFWKQGDREGAIGFINACLGGREQIEPTIFIPDKRPNIGDSPIRYSKYYLRQNICNQLYCLQLLLNWSLNSPDSPYTINRNPALADGGIRDMLRFNYLRCKRMVKKHPDAGYDVNRFENAPIFKDCLRIINSNDQIERDGADTWLKNNIQNLNTQAGGGKWHGKGGANDIHDDPLIQQSSNFLDTYFKWSDGHEGELRKDTMDSIIDHIACLNEIKLDDINKLLEDIVDLDEKIIAPTEKDLNDVLNEMTTAAKESTDDSLEEDGLLSSEWTTIAENMAAGKTFEGGLDVTRTSSLAEDPVINLQKELADEMAPEFLKYLQIRLLDATETGDMRIQKYDEINEDMMEIISGMLFARRRLDAPYTYGPASLQKLWNTFEQYTSNNSPFKKWPRQKGKRRGQIWLEPSDVAELKTLLSRNLYKETVEGDVPKNKIDCINSKARVIYAYIKEHINTGMWGHIDFNGLVGRKSNSPQRLCEKLFGEKAIVTPTKNTPWLEFTIPTKWIETKQRDTVAHQKEQSFSQYLKNQNKLSDESRICTLKQTLKTVAKLNAPGSGVRTHKLPSPLRKLNVSELPAPHSDIQDGDRQLAISVGWMNELLENGSNRMGISNHNAGIRAVLNHEFFQQKRIQQERIRLDNWPIYLRGLRMNDWHDRDSLILFHKIYMENAMEQPGLDRSGSHDSTTSVGSVGSVTVSDDITGVTIKKKRIDDDPTGGGKKKKKRKRKTKKKRKKRKRTKRRIRKKKTKKRRKRRKITKRKGRKKR